MKYNNIKTPKELYKYMRENIRYGFVNQDDKIFLRNKTYEFYYMEQLFRNYKFQNAAEVILNKVGICYDQNELMRYWLYTHDYEATTYYSSIRNHSLLVYQDNNKYNWIETTYKNLLGIHEFNSLHELFEYYIFSQEGDYQTTDIHEYDIKDYGVDFYTFVNKARNSKILKK